MSYGLTPGEYIGTPFIADRQIVAQVDGERQALVARVRSAFFLEFLFFGGTEPGGRLERIAVVVERKIANVQRQRAGGALFVHDHRHGAPLDTLAKHDAAAAGEPGVRKTLHGSIIPRRSGGGTGSAVTGAP